MPANPPAPPVALTPEDLSRLDALEKEAFRAPWTYSRWEVECEACDAGTNTPESGECINPDCDGTHVPITAIESPEEYPDGQLVAQISVPGLLSLADKNGALIAGLRNSASALLQAARERDELREKLRAAEQENAAVIEAKARSGGTFILALSDYERANLLAALEAIMAPDTVLGVLDTGDWTGMIRWALGSLEQMPNHPGAAMVQFAKDRQAQEVEQARREGYERGKAEASTTCTCERSDLGVYHHQSLCPVHRNEAT